MKQATSIIAAVALLVLSGCTAKHHRSSPTATQLQMREVQTRTFEECEIKSVMKAMINVLQDEGYIVKNAVLDLGLLTAEKNIDIDQPVDEEVFLVSIFKGSQEKKPSYALMEVSANVTDFGSGTKVRVNFQKKTIDSNGCVKEVEQVMKDLHYQNFFAKVSKGIFLQTENL